MKNQWNWKQILSFFLLFLPALVFYALQKNLLNQATGTFLQNSARKLQRSYDGFTHRIQDSLNTYFQLVGTNKENKDLKTENAKLASKLQRLGECQVENTRLHKLFQFQQKQAQKTLAARVISKDLLLDQESLIIDKGSTHGVKRLQGVISTRGIVGYTIDVKAGSSQVLLLSNHNASVDALIQRTRARGIVSGLSSKTFQLNYIMRQSDARKGDQVVTSGRQGFFPKGFPIGTVRDVKLSPTGISYLAKIDPSVEMNRLENVLVIVDKVLGEIAPDP